MDTPTRSGAGGEHGKRTFAAAARFTALVVVVAVLVLVAGLVWISDCRSGSGDAALAHCGAVRRNAVALGSPIVLLSGGVVAFVRTYRIWRARGPWWVWQGAGWFLLALMVVVLTLTTPAALL